jgi:predicted nucleic acid-binding protein
VIVVDVSAFVDVLLGRPAALEVLSSLTDERPDEPLHAPALIGTEVLNALRRLARAGIVTDERATAAADDFAHARMVLYPHSPLHDGIWRLRHDLSAYDAAYLALAELLDRSALVTSDSALADQATRRLGASRVAFAGG